MATRDSCTTPLALTLKISSEAREKLAQKAAQSGQALEDYVSTLVEQTVEPARSLEEISGPLQDEFRKSGMTEDELADFLEDAKHRRRQQRQTHR